jgi:hypothetical protein
MDSDNKTKGEQILEALKAARALGCPRPSPRLEFAEYVNSLDAMELHIARFLFHNLHIPTTLLPALIPLIDQRWFQDRLEAEVSNVLLDLEDLG